MNLAGEYFVSGGRYASLRRAMAGFVDAGDNPPGCDSPEYLVSHEYGHSVYYRLDTPKYEHWQQTEDMAAICMDAKQSLKEVVAEGFAMIQHTGRTDWPRAVRRLEQLLREDGMI